jgi:hypothetical protein
VRTAHQVGHKEMIARELMRYKISVAALSELRLTGSGTTEIQVPDADDAILLYYSGGDHHTEGVGFAVNKRISKSVAAFQPISSRVAIMTLLGTIQTHIIAVYAPTEVSNDAAKDEFYSQLQSAFDSLPKRDMILIAGDLNAHAGATRQGWEDTLDPWGIGEMNDNGLRLLSFASTNGLTIGNSLFRHPMKHQLTWRSPNGKDTAQLDYILVTKRFRTSLNDVRTMRGADCGSDHHLVRALLQLRLKRPSLRQTHNSRKDWPKLTEPTYKQKFQLALSNRFAALTQLEDVESAAITFTEIVTECATSICPDQRKKTQAWISDAALELIDKRKQYKNTDKTKYQQLNRETRRRLRVDRAAHWDRVAGELEDAAHRHQFRTLYTTLRRLTGKVHSASDNIRKSDGAFARSTSEKLYRWREYFERLYNHPAPDGALADPPDLGEPTETISEEEPSIAEINIAVKQLKNNKAAGADEITAEALKAGGDLLAQRLHSLITLIWQSESIPMTWKHAIIVPVYKKGDKHDCKNYRGISLLSIVSKVFMRIIQRRIQNRKEEITREEQAGFRVGRGCCDQIFTLRQLLEQRIRCGKRLIIVFIDFAAAFDSVHQPALWNALKAEGIPTKIIRLLQNIYDRSISQIRIKGELTKDFEIRTGVRQGCVLSPALFNTVVDAIMRKAFDGQRGVQFGQDQYVTDLMYADDSAVFAETETEASEILQRIKTAAYPYGLKINADKTKAFTSDGSHVSIHLDGFQLEQVQQFKYLGCIIEQNKIACTADIATRIGLAASAFGALTWCVWKKANISISTKMRIFRSLILSVLLYGAESWTLLQADLNRLEVFQMRCLRRILGVSLLDRIRNETIRARCCGQSTITNEIQKRRLRWFGHVCRQSPNHYPYKLLWHTRPTTWITQRTAPKKTWTSQLKNDLAKIRLSPVDAKEAALDRQKWKSIICDIQAPVIAPTAAYWLRGRPRPDAR